MNKAKQFYNMAFNPFEKSQKEGIAFETDDIRQISGRLDDIKDKGGIGLILAEPGYGKTFALRHWANKLNVNSVHFVYICMSTVTNHNFYVELCSGLGIDARYRKCDLFQDIQTCVTTLVEQLRKKVVVAIDEAQYLPMSVLVDLPMIANFEMDSIDKLSIVLVGQSQLAHTLSRLPLSALRQRIRQNYTMCGLDKGECKDYVKTQLSKAGTDPNLFSEGAIENAFVNSSGSIRTLNAILSFSLVIGAQKKMHSLDSEIINLACQEIAI